ncbi:MAG: hypothetical protein IJ776_08045 [Paludibacteraceae bacterium]|nr:hypothetical protein [Paludibacteraceae bacterium]
MNLFDLTAAFFRWMGKVCIGAWHLCLDSVRLALHYWFITVPCIIIFFGAGYYYSRPLNRIYKAEAIVYLNGPLAEDVKQAFRPLEFSYRFFPNQEITAALNLTPDQADGLVKFETFEVIDFLNDSTADMVDYRHKHDVTDTINVVMPNVMCLRFRTKRPDNVPVVGEHILAYLNSNPSLQASFEKKRALQERKVQFCHDQLEKLDSLTSAFYFEQGGAAQAQMKWGNGMVLGRREIKLFTPEIMEFYNTTEHADRELAMCTAPVVAQQAFTTIPRALNGRLKCTLIALITGYILGCLIALALKRRKEIAEWYRKG